MAEKPWGGVFQEATDRRVEEFTESVSFDRRLYAQDIEGSIAHAQMLAKVGLITADECQQIEQSLEEIRQEIEQGRFAFRTELEDIHMHVEAGAGRADRRRGPETPYGPQPKRSGGHRPAALGPLRHRPDRRPLDGFATGVCRPVRCATPT